MDMSCNCRVQVEQLVREQTGDTTAKLRGQYVISNGVIQFKPTVAAVYRKKKRDGSVCKTEIEIEISYEYCPFCGRKFNESSYEQTPSM